MYGVLGYDLRLTGEPLDLLDAQGSWMPVQYLAPPEKLSRLLVQGRGALAQEPHQRTGVVQQMIDASRFVCIQFRAPLTLAMNTGSFASNSALTTHLGQ